jgi:hypothetical protein
MKRFKCKIRRFRKLLAYYLLGYYPVDHEVERLKNIDLLFGTTYEWKNVVAEKYDFYYHIHHNDEVAKEKTFEFFTEPNIVIA